MAAQTKNQATEQDGPVQHNLFSGTTSTSRPEVEKEQAEQDKKTGSASAADLRKASYFVLTIAAVFVINAMETGSYRTPWPVAVVVSLAGIWLLAYSFVKANREKPDA